jgi:hypothetical protein
LVLGIVLGIGALRNGIHSAVSPSITHFSQAVECGRWGLEWIVKYAGNGESLCWNRDEIQGHPCRLNIPWEYKTSGKAYSVIKAFMIPLAHVCNALASAANLAQLVAILHNALSMILI